MMRCFVIVLFCFWLLAPSSSVAAEDLPVTSDFGWRIHPVSGEWKFHSGVDLGYGYGTGISALFDGVVVQAGNFDDGYGNQVLLYHDAIDSFTRYAHCSALYCQEGDYVTAGDVIGAVGSTGNATGPHLHLEYMIPTDSGYQYEDPLVLFE